MKTVMLVCSAGMSTSLLVNKIRVNVINKGLDLKIIAASEAEARSLNYEVDVLLLGPQVRYLAEKLRDLLGEQGTKVSIIDSISYGTLDGEAVLNQALALIEEDS